jgi:hypothetical protein
VMQQLKTNRVVTALKVSRGHDGVITWLHTTMTRLRVAQGDLSGIYLACFHQVEPPADYRPRVWTADHLIHVGYAQETRAVAAQA